MRKIALSAVVATSALAAVAAWAASTASTTYARVDVLPGAQIDLAQLMMNATDLPEMEFVDYTFVYN